MSHSSLFTSFGVEVVVPRYLDPAKNQNALEFWRNEACLGLANHLVDSGAANIQVEAIEVDGAPKFKLSAATMLTNPVVAYDEKVSAYANMLELVENFDFGQDEELREAVDKVMEAVKPPEVYPLN